VTDEQSIFREKLAELENVIRLKDEQLAMKEERSLLRDATIGDLKGDLDKQYYAHLDEMDRMKLELDEAKRDAGAVLDPKLKGGEKFKLVNEIREKTKLLRESEERVDTLKRRETQIRETCEAWKKEVDVVREVSDEGLKQLKFQHEQEIIQIRKRADTNVKRLKAENDEIIGRNAILLRENEQLRVENSALNKAPLPTSHHHHQNQQQQHHHQNHHQRGGFQQRGNFRGNHNRGNGGGRGRGGANRGGYQNNFPLSAPPPPPPAPVALFDHQAAPPPPPPAAPAQVMANSGFVSFGEDEKQKRLYTPSQALKRHEKLLDRLIQRAKEAGVPFVPDNNGPLAELYAQRVAMGLIQP